MIEWFIGLAVLLYAICFLIAGVGLEQNARDIDRLRHELRRKGVL